MMRYPTPSGPLALTYRRAWLSSVSVLRLAVSVWYFHQLPCITSLSRKHLLVGVNEWGCWRCPNFLIVFLDRFRIYCTFGCLFFYKEASHCCLWVVSVRISDCFLSFLSLMILSCSVATWIVHLTMPSFSVCVLVHPWFVELVLPGLRRFRWCPFLSTVSPPRRSYYVWLLCSCSPLGRSLFLRGPRLLVLSIFLAYWGTCSSVVMQCVFASFSGGGVFARISCLLGFRVLWQCVSL